MNISKQKMSKSRGNVISPLRYLNLGLDSGWFRYYIADKLSRKINDIDFTPDNFIKKINSDLIGKYLNIGSRSAHFITSYFNGNLKYRGETNTMISIFSKKVKLVKNLLESFEYNKAIRNIMCIADNINKNFNLKKPWLLTKNLEDLNKLQDVCSRALAGFKVLSVMLSPVLPSLSYRIARELFLSDRNFTWDDAIILPRTIVPFKHFMQRVQSNIIEKLFD